MRARGSLLAVGLGLVLVGCEREEIRVYRAPKEPIPMQATGAMKPPENPAKVVWTVPAGWEQLPNSQQMRIATFKSGGIEIALSAFPGDVGGMLANVNRWLGQLGANPVEESDLATLLTTERVGDVAIWTMRLVGPEADDMLAAVVQPGDGQSWFVKAIGPREALTPLTESFHAFARSIRRETGAPAEAAPVPSAPAPSGAAQPAAGVLGRLASFSPPETWKQGTDPSRIAAVLFDAPGAVRITATTLSGDGGGPIPNINRWRGQLGLDPITTLDASNSTDLGSGAVRVDFTDAAGANRMISVIVPEGGRTWFFKLTGPAAAAATEAAAFDRFVRTVGLGEP